MNANLSSVLGCQTRRHFLCESGLGLGSIAFLALGGRPGLDSAEAAGSLHARPPHFPPRAKRVIQLFMAGGPSQLELFDPKPKLAEMAGQPLPSSITDKARFAFIKKDARLLANWRRFARHGQSGAELSELLPHIAGIADDIAVVRSMQTDNFNHGPAKLLSNTGTAKPGWPALGSWLSYGLGSECEDLPGYVVLHTGSRGPRGGAALWSSGFLPTTFEGVVLRTTGAPILDLASPPGIDPRGQRQVIDAVTALNAQRYAHTGDPQIAARIANYEMAYRMQTSAPELMDLAGETKETFERYGADPAVPSFARNCLLARRLAERGVRFIQLYHTDWDHHGGSATNNIEEGIENRCREVDQPSAALVADLKARGMLDETLVIWGGEFGRTPMGEDKKPRGRDHHIQGYSIWLAGGGIRAGITLGRTDEFGFHAVEDAVHIHDLHATILHLLGLDHLRLTYRRQGRDFRLTDVGGHVVKKLLA